MQVYQLILKRSSPNFPFQQLIAFLICATTQMRASDMISPISIAKASVNNSMNNQASLPSNTMAHNPPSHHHNPHNPPLLNSNFDNSMSNSSLANMLDGFNPPPDPIFSNSSATNHSGMLF